MKFALDRQKYWAIGLGAGRWEGKTEIMIAFGPFLFGVKW